MEKKIITIFNYNGDRVTDEELQKINWYHKMQSESELLDIVRILYEKTNLNIQIVRHTGEHENHVTVFVTMYSRFTQR